MGAEEPTPYQHERKNKTVIRGAQQYKNILVWLKLGDQGEGTCTKWYEEVVFPATSSGYILNPTPTMETTNLLKLLKCEELWICLRKS